MKFKDLDFKGGYEYWNLYSNYSEDQYFTIGFLNQDLLSIEYKGYSIDLGWYQDRYIIYILIDNPNYWNSIHKIEIFEHEKIFETLQFVINNKDKYLKLYIFS